jgi:hypothetical protein
MHPQQNNPNINAPTSKPISQSFHPSNQSLQQQNPYGQSNFPNLSQLPPRKHGGSSVQTGTYSKDIRPIYESRFNLLPRTQDFK